MKLPQVKSENSLKQTHVKNKKNLSQPGGTIPGIPGGLAGKPGGIPGGAAGSAPRAVVPPAAVTSSSCFQGATSLRLHLNGRRSSHSSNWTRESSWSRTQWSCRHSSTWPTKHAKKMNTSLHRVMSCVMLLSKKSSSREKPHQLCSKDHI